MTSPPVSLRVCVIGAGPGGLAMARLLTAQGHAVTVLERIERAGGMCRSVKFEGRWFDVGANYVTKDYREVRALRIYEGATDVQKVIIARSALAAGDS